MLPSVFGAQCWHTQCLQTTPRHARERHLLLRRRPQLRHSCRYTNQSLPNPTTSMTNCWSKAVPHKLDLTAKNLARNPKRYTPINACSCLLPTLLLLSPSLLSLYKNPYPKKPLITIPIRISNIQPPMTHRHRPLVHTPPPPQLLRIPNALLPRHLGTL